MDQGSHKRQRLSTFAHHQIFKLERQIYNLWTGLGLAMPRVAEQQWELEFYQEQVHIVQECHKDLLRQMSRFPLGSGDPAPTILTEEKIVEEIPHPSSR